MTPRDDRDWSEPSEVHLTRIDVPFLDLTWFFVKASMALGVAFLVTSWLWVVIGAGVVTLAAGLVVSAGVPAWFVPPPPAPVAMAVALPVEPVAEPAPPQEPVAVPMPDATEVAEAPPPPPPPVETARPIGQTEAARAASEAAQLAEIERIRRERR